MSREVLKKFENIEQKEGDGVKVRRSLGTSQVIKPKLLFKIKLNKYFINKTKVKIS